MTDTPPQRLFQGVRKGQTVAGNGIFSADTEATVTLCEVAISPALSESVILVLKNDCFVNISLLPSGFRSKWRLSLLSVQQCGFENRFTIDIPFHSEAIEFLHLEKPDISTAQEVQEHQDMSSSRYFRTREDAIYTAYFVQRAAEPPLPAEKRHSCLTLINNNDVAFIFPFEGTSLPRLLWANKAKLTQSSAYFGAIVSSGFEQSGKSLAEVSKIFTALKQDLTIIAAAEREKSANDLPKADDSDDEAEATGDDEDETWLVQDKTGEDAISYVVIRDTPYKTYRALFEWFETRDITFAPLKSTRLETSEVTQASPKSVYRLCHQLGIDDLQALALANFESQLSPSNVLHELFSINCFHYPELRAAALRVLEQDWTVIKANGGLDTLLSMVRQEGSDTKEMMEVAIDILRRV